MQELPMRNPSPLGIAQKNSVGFEKEEEVFEKIWG